MVNLLTRKSLKYVDVFKIEKKLAIKFHDEIMWTHENQ